MESILALYSATCQPLRVTALGNAGGFSGARLWKATTSDGDICVRRWPQQHPSQAHLAWIHQVLEHACCRNCSFLPRPLRSNSGNSFVCVGGYLWEVTPWMPGAANFHRQRSAEKLRAAMTALARFHLASQEFESAQGPSPGLRERINFVDWLQTDGWELCRKRTAERPFDEFTDKCHQVMDLALPLVNDVPRTLGPLVELGLPLQPCLRDIWHDHVLFDEVGRVSGFVDFGAMRIESVAADVARLMDSLAGGDATLTNVALSAYQRLRPLSDLEQSAVYGLRQANVALSGINWVRWLMVEGRPFDDTTQVHRRLDEILRRLRRPDGSSLDQESL